MRFFLSLDTNDSSGGHALTPEAMRPVALVAIMHVCSWLLMATGMFQIVVAKCADFRYVSFLGLAD